MSERLTIEGGQPLRGIYRVQGNKNAALPLVAASVLSPGPLTLRNVPNIIDINNLISLMEGLGVRTEWHGRNLLIDPGHFALGCAGAQDGFSYLCSSRRLSHRKTLI